MNKFSVIIIIMLVGIAAAFTGILPRGENRELVSQTTTNESCIESGAPIVSDTMTLVGEVYELIKKDALVQGAKIVNMGSVSGRDDVYKLIQPNYFGEAVDESIIYVLKSKEENGAITHYIFDIYLKRGEPIPDYVRNCRKQGGLTQVIPSTGTDFPPNSFNTDQVVGPQTNLLTAPAYIYTGSKNTLPDVENLDGVNKNIGTLPVGGKNYPLHFHLGTAYLIKGNDAYVYNATDEPIDVSQQDQKSLQLKEIKFVRADYYSWWTPACKPAIYLYPKEKTNVHVEVLTKGLLTLTIPQYPESGWTVTAHPNGKIDSNGQSYPYLYYESKIEDSLISKPKSGFVVPFENLPAMYDTLLPKLGLLGKEKQEFKDYWEKVLPYAPYYFVGVMEKEAIDSIEPLIISPKPTTIIRVRLYFEALDKPITVVSPKLVAPERNGFTVVEWGGMVKVDKDNPFTCSQ